MHLSNTIGHHDKADKVSNAQSSLVDILPGDCVIVGTDGLFDNLFDEQIADIVCKHIIEAKGKVNLALVTKVLRKVLADAFGASMVKRGMMTPYSEAAMNEFNLVFSGMFLFCFDCCLHPVSFFCCCFFLVFSLLTISPTDGHTLDNRW